MKRTIAFLLGLGLAVVAVAGRSWMGDRARLPWRGQALMDSARSVPPKLRMEWLYEHGRMEDRRLRTEDGPATTDSGLVLRGKWGRGPAAEVTGKDTLVVLTLGSEVALLSFANVDSPRVLSEIQFPSLTAQSYLVDSLLYTSSNVDLEVWNVCNPTAPVKRGELLGAMGDFWIRDTFLFYIRRDTFHVISIANPANMYELGSCLESGSVTTGSGNTVVVCQSGGFAFVDVSNPASPHEVGTYPCGHTLTAAARGNLVCASYEEAGYPYPVRFITLDISTPSPPRLLAKLNNLGGYDIFLDGPLAFVSGRGPGVENPQPFQILSIADSAHPALIDSCRTTFDYAWGVWENSALDLAFAADKDDGLAVIDIHNLNNPVLDTWVLKTGSAVDVHVDGDLCYVAGETDGFRLLDVTDPTQPVFLSGLDTSWTDASNYALTARDSFAFVGWRKPFLRVVSVTDPLHPQMVAACSLFNPPEDMVLRDSFVYCAEDGRLEIVNVARSRAPAVVGSCALPERSREVILADTLAYVATLDGIEIVSVVRPDAPQLVASWPRTVWAIDIQDTVLYATTYTNDTEDVLISLSIANPASPVVLDSAAVPRTMQDVVVVDSVAYCAGDEMVFVNVADPHNLRRLPYRWVPPSMIRRVIYFPPYLYTCCTEGGVCISETLKLGIAEQSGRIVADRIRAVPTVTTGHVRLLADGPWRGRVCVYDAIGVQVAETTAAFGQSSGGIDLSSAPGGVYLLHVETDKGSNFVKVVKTTRR